MIAVIRKPRDLINRIDFLYLGTILVITAFGLVVLYGATSGVAGLDGVADRQLLWWGISCGVFLVAMTVPYPWLRFLGWPAYAGSLLVLLLLLFHVQLPFTSAVKSHGALSWYQVELGSLSFRLQPAEFAKIALATCLAHWISLRQSRLNHWYESILPIILMILPVLAIVKQPDLGTALIFVPIPFILLFVAGVPWKWVVIVIVSGLLLATGGIYALLNFEHIPGLKEYHRGRIRVFLEPIAQPFSPPGIEEILYGEPAKEKNEKEKAEALEKKSRPGGDEHNIRQAEMALGSGRIFGKGWKHGTQTRLRFLPEHHTDFIFSSLGEQFGLVGCLAFLGLYFLLAWRALRMAVLTQDPFGRFLVIALLSIIFIHLFFNTAMTVRLMPVAGVPLPLFSYGGSFLATSYLIFGLIANVGFRNTAPRLMASSSSATRIDPSAGSTSIVSPSLRETSRPKGKRQSFNWRNKE
jgi:rod shape determining protein RodA